MPPTALLETLRTIGQKVRAYAIAIGIGALAAVAVGLLAAIVFIDWAAHFTGPAPGGLPGAVRLAMELICRRPARFCRHRLDRPAGFQEAFTSAMSPRWIEERYPAVRRYPPQHRQLPRAAMFPAPTR